MNTVNEPERKAEFSRSGESGVNWKKNLYLCLFGSFTTLLSLTMLVPFLPIFIQELGTRNRNSIAELSGTVFGATFLGIGLMAPVWGHLGDRYGKKRMLIRAVVGMAVTMPLIGLVQNVWQLIGLRLIMGLVGGYATSATQLVAAQAPRDRAGWALGILSTGSLAGGLIGPLVGGFLPGRIGIRDTFFLSGGLIAIAAVTTITMVTEKASRAGKGRHSQAAKVEVRTAPIPALVLAALLTTAMLVIFANMSVEPIITLYLQTLRGPHTHDVWHAGVIMSASAFGSMLVAARAGRWADRFGSWTLIKYSFAATSAVLMLQAIAQTWWQLLGLRFLMGMALVGTLPAVVKLIQSMSPPSSLGTLLGYVQSCQHAGQVIGPLAGGYVSAHLGMRAVFAMTASGLFAMSIVNRSVGKMQITANC